MTALWTQAGARNLAGLGAGVMLAFGFAGNDLQAIAAGLLFYLAAILLS